MNKTIRFLAITFLISIIVSIAILVFGRLANWGTVAQFRNGFFWTSVIFIITGIVTIMDVSRMRTDGTLLYRLFAGDKNMSERQELRFSDRLLGYRAFSLFLLTGVYLQLFSILIASI